MRLGGKPYKGEISKQVTGTPWQYKGPRAWHRIFDKKVIAKVLADPLSRAIAVVLGNLRASGDLPVGPRGTGYANLGLMIGGRLVVKDKDPYLDAMGLRTGSAERKAEAATMISFEDIGEHIVSLRLCGLVDPAEIADQRTVEEVLAVYEDEDELLEYLRQQVEGARPDLLAAVGCSAEVVTEAAATIDLLVNYVAPWGVRRVVSGSGDVPWPCIEAMSVRIVVARGRGRDVHIGIVGDGDIDGIENADAFVVRLRAEVERRTETLRRAADEGRIEGSLPDDFDSTFTVTWLGPTEDVLARWPGLPAERPGKARKDGTLLGFSLQAEAMVPGGELRTVVEEWLEDLCPLDDPEAVEAREDWEAVQEAVLDRLA